MVDLPGGLLALARILNSLNLTYEERALWGVPG